MDYSNLFADALADVEAGNRHACKTTEHCCEMGGCPRCFQGVMRGDIGIEHVDVFDSVLRITTTGHDGKAVRRQFPQRSSDHSRGARSRCLLSVRSLPMTVEKAVRRAMAAARKERG